MVGTSNFRILKFPLIIWLVVSNRNFIFHFINGMSSFPLTNSYFSRWLKPPTSNYHGYLCSIIICSVIFYSVIIMDILVPINSYNPLSLDIMDISVLYRSLSSRPNIRQAQMGEDSSQGQVVTVDFLQKYIRRGVTGVDRPPPGWRMGKL